MGRRANGMRALSEGSGDLMLDKRGKLAALKVDVGSFLGIGGKDKFDPDRKVLITSMNKDQIKKLPEYKS
jgi:hypothetical protein